MDFLPDDMDSKVMGTESFESIMGSLGLTERKPIPEPVHFGEADPLGNSTMATAGVREDIITSLSKY